MSKNFNDFRNFISNNPDAIAEIVNRSGDTIKDDPIVFENTEEGIIKFANGLVSTSTKVSLVMMIDFLQLYHQWLNGELPE